MSKPYPRRPPELAREIFLVLPTAHEPNREICRGIFRYALPSKNWIFFFVMQDPQIIRRLSVSQRTAGLIGRVGHPELAKAAASLKIPVINVHGGTPMEGLPVVGPDFEEVGRFAARRILETGMPNIGYYGLKSQDFSVVTLRGFQAELQERGRSVIVYEPSAEEKVLQAGKRKLPQKEWLRSVPKPIAIYCPEDIFAHEIGYFSSQLHLRIPEEVSILGTNNDELFDLAVQPAISSIRLPWQEIGHRAAQLMDDLIHGKKKPDEPIRLGPPDFVPRQSTQVFRCRDEIVERAMQIIRANVNQSLTVDQLAQQCGASRRSLEKRFRSVLNRSPLQEFHRMRVEEIKLHLRQDTRTIEQISELCGFSSPVYLSQFFHRETGMSPGAYRRSFNATLDRR